MIRIRHFVMQPKNVHAYTNFAAYRRQVYRVHINALTVCFSNDFHSLFCRFPMEFDVYRLVTAVVEDASSVHVRRKAVKNCTYSFAVSRRCNIRRLSDFRSSSCIQRTVNTLYMWTNKRFLPSTNSFSCICIKSVKDNIREILMKNFSTL